MAEQATAQRAIAGTYIAGDNAIEGGFRPCGVTFVTVREIIRRIEADGWYLARQRGSHRQFKHPTKAGLVTVSGHPPLNIAPKTEKSILRQAGLDP